MRIAFLVLVGLASCEPAQESCADTTNSPKPTIAIISDVSAYGLPILHLENTMSGGARGRMLLQISDHFETLYVALFFDGEEQHSDYYEARYPETVISFGFYEPDLLDGKQVVLEIGDLGSSFGFEQPIWIEYHSDYEN